MSSADSKVVSFGSEGETSVFSPTKNEGKNNAGEQKIKGSKSSMKRLGKKHRRQSSKLKAKNLRRKNEKEFIDYSLNTSLPWIENYTNNELSNIYTPSLASYGELSNVSITFSSSNTNTNSNNNSNTNNTSNTNNNKFDFTVNSLSPKLIVASTPGLTPGLTPVLTPIALTPINDNEKNEENKKKLSKLGVLRQSALDRDNFNENEIEIESEIEKEDTFDAMPVFSLDSY